MFIYIYLAVTSLFDISEFASKLSIEQLAGLRSHINIELKTIISMTKKSILYFVTCNYNIHTSSQNSMWTLDTV